MTAWEKAREQAEEKTLADMRRYLKAAGAVLEERSYYSETLKGWWYGKLFLGKTARDAFTAAIAGVWGS